ncbi:hypothetical protein [Mameliella sediminis]|uniref:hypothetical protein n=1 Tax=Mameliella sediminis TaxID=2836866 RepID=UPI001C457845|nr:hypothetical protein [Mameliella sediminis]MBV7396228.1 hypothetical protein [Mameliella sediminis]MBY6114994.1 hypothetical protein [Antarctobacter heliothermus]MBY6145121.1 hypothetical protein [Mameliella alba]MCA0956546.1 hypothetical protein [Mameliella alba]
MLNPFPTSLSHVRKITFWSGLVSIVAGVFLLLWDEPVHKTGFQGIALLSLYLLPLIFGFVALGQGRDSGPVKPRRRFARLVDIVLFILFLWFWIEKFPKIQHAIQRWLSENAYWIVPLAMLAPGAILLLVSLRPTTRVA